MNFCKIYNRDNFLRKATLSRVLTYTAVLIDLSKDEYRWEQDALDLTRISHSWLVSNSHDANRDKVSLQRTYV